MWARLMYTEPFEYDDWPEDETNLCFLLSEKVLGRDWNRPEEDIAWAYLQPHCDAKQNGLPRTP